MMTYAADAQTKIGTHRLEKVQGVMLQRLYDKVGLILLYRLVPNLEKIKPERDEACTVVYQ